MERRRDQLDQEWRPCMVCRSAAPTWHDAVRRAAIQGSVFAGHLAILMLVLHPSWRRIAHVTRQHDDHVLRLSFDRLPKLVRPSPAPVAMRLPARTKPVRQAIALSAQMAATVAHSTNPPVVTIPIMTPPSTPGDPHRSYQPGDFQSALQNAQRTRADHIPGTTTPRIAGISPQARSSIQGIVHMLVKTSQCTNEQFQLQNSAHQFTPEMIDHALEVEGCGPHLEHAPADATIDAIAHQAIFGN
ncbi:hypothetical protein B0E50_05960 [Rhodanobacter sp. C01]|nr:hypothetical protein B0E50_05960 [Rhodanobacter sp. C01]